MKLLAVVSNFRQGWGGGPESVRLLARVLADHNVTVDVFDRGKFHANVGSLATLPRASDAGVAFDWASLPSYRAALVFGPWQDQRAFRPLLAPAAPPLIYLPRGGLARIEFARTRDLKKWPYLAVFERRIIRAARRVVYSSDIEQSHTVPLARKPGHEVIIPDLFAASEPLSRIRGAGTPAALSFAFMAEIAPRKGLLPLIHGFAEFARAYPRQVKLTIAGSVRAGSERYCEGARNAAESLPVNACVEFVGPVSGESRPEFYRDCDTFIVSSLFESFGLTVLEGLSAGCHVIATPDIGVLQYLPPGPSLSRARSASPHDLARALADQAAVLADRRDTAPSTMDYASSAIAALNKRAVSAWMKLLEF